MNSPEAKETKEVPEASYVPMNSVFAYFHDIPVEEATEANNESGVETGEAVLPKIAKHYHIGKIINIPIDPIHTGPYTIAIVLSKDENRALIVKGKRSAVKQVVSQLVPCIVRYLTFSKSCRKDMRNGANRKSPTPVTICYNTPKNRNTITIRKLADVSNVKMGHKNYVVRVMDHTGQIIFEKYIRNFPTKWMKDLNQFTIVPQPFAPYEEPPF